MEIKIYSNYINVLKHTGQHITVSVCFSIGRELLSLLEE